MDLPLGYSDGKVGSAAGLADAGDTPVVLSVPRRPLYVVDHERFDRPFRRFELQAELSLDRSEYRTFRVGCGGEAIHGRRRPKRGKPGSLSRELDTNIELACDSGLVEYRAA